MRYNIGHNKGFTLIELMIVVVIIGVLAAMAIPRFMRSAVKTKQSEAKSILKQIYVNQHAYRQQSSVNGYFNPGAVASGAAPTVLHPIWVDIATDALYSYNVVAAAKTFTATATANLDDDATIDTWTIDDQGILVCTTNDVDA